MGRAIEPLFGSFATSLFMVGLLGASFSSLIGNASIGGTLLGDALGLGSHLNNKKTRLLIMLVMISGALVAILFGRLPLNLIVLASGLTIFIVPIVGTAIYLTAIDEKIMGDLKDKWMANVIGFLGLLILIGLAIRNVNLIFN